MQMITNMKSLLFAAACFMAGTTGQAQNFSGSVEQYPTKDYAGSPIEFSLKEVAEKLGTDAATLGTAIYAYINAETPDPILFYCGDTPWSAAVEADHHGFWMDATGAAVGWGDNSIFYVSPDLEGVEGGSGEGVKGDVNGDGSVDVADISAIITVMAGDKKNEATADVNADGSVDVADISAVISIMAGGTVAPTVSEDAKLVFNLGQMPEKMAAGDVAHTTIKLTFNEKSVGFDLKLSVIAKPAVEIPAPATEVEKELNIVGTAEVSLTQKARTGYDSDNFEVEIADLAEKLGITNTEVLTDAEYLDSILYAPVYNDGDIEDGGGMKKDTLSHKSTAGEVPSFWFRQVQDASGELSGEVAAYGYNSADCFYIEGIKYDADSKKFTGRLGQYPGVLKGGENLFANLYVIFGDKAYQIKVSLTVEEVQQGNGLADYTKVGETSITVEQEPTDDYAAIGLKPDLETIAAALGCETNALAINALDDKDNFASPTANYGGFWFSDNGTVVAHGGSAALYIEPAENGNLATLNLGQYPNHFKVGDEATVALYFMNGDNYYTYNVTLKVIEPKVVEHNFESVATRNFNVQHLVDAGYIFNEIGSIEASEIATLLGTSDPVLYGLNIDSVAAVSGLYTKKYTCTPYPGFWLNVDGRNGGWGAPDATLGICYADGEFTGCQYPQRTSVGQVFKTQLFLVNEETNKMITFNFTINFVEVISNAEVVGTENITLPVSTDGALVKIDAQKACDALGITIEELLNPNNFFLRGLSSDGSYGEGKNSDDGLSFNIMDGGYDGYGDIYLYLEQDGSDVLINIGSNAEVSADFSKDGQFCIEANEKRYEYVVKFVSPAIYEAAQ